MILLKRGAGDPDRIADAVRILRPSPLDEVVDAVIAYAASGGIAVYVECLDGQYRWSPATRGGGYPLIRVLARFLRCEHYEITIGLATVEGWGIIQADDTNPRWQPYMILENIPRDPRVVTEVIASRLADE